MNVLLLLIALAVALPILLYAFAPAVLFRRVQAALRRKAKLVRKTIHVDGIDWPYLEGGPANGEIVVMVHGFGADKDHWTYYAPFMTGDYRLIAPDLPGFGENDLSANRSYAIKAQADRLIGFLDAMGIQSCHLGGNSMGGFIALQVALDHPKRVKSLTLVNNAGVVGAEESDLQKAVAQGENPLVMREFADVDKLMAFVMEQRRPIPRQFKKVIFAEAKRREALLDLVFEHIARDALEAPVTDRLPKVKHPTLIVWGRHDRVIDVSCVDVLAKGIKNSETVIFEHLGHIPMMEDPAAFAGAHRAFLAKA